MTKAQKAEREESRAKLLEWLKPGMTVYLILRHVSRSGMQRTITPLLIDADGSQSYLGYHVGRFLGERTDGDHGVKVSGCGMDMGFALVYDLAARLWPDGYGCTGDGCRSNDHANGDRDYTPHGACRDCLESTHDVTSGHDVKHWHRDGGYALRHRWL